MDDDALSLATIASTEVRATPENPSFDINSPDAWEALGAEPSASGIRVNHKSALTYSPWWRGINLISQTVSKLPLFLYKRKGDGKERFPQHPAYNLIRYKANEYQTALIFQQQLMAHALSMGNGYAIIERDQRNGDPIALLPVDPTTMNVVRKDGEVGYLLNLPVGSRLLDPSSVLHIRGLGYDGLVGYSVIECARDAIGLGIGQGKFAAKSLSQGGRPGVVLETPNTIPEKDRIHLRDTWEKMHSGIDNAHRTAILDRGLKANAIAFSADDQQFIEQRKFQIIDIANFLGIPAHKLGSTDRTSYASLEQENASFLDDCLDFWLCNWEYEVREKLLAEKEKRGDSVVVEFERKALMRADATARGNLYRAGLGGHPWMTVDEVRGLENMNPLGGIAAELQPPANMGGMNNQPDDPAKSNVKPGRDVKMVATVRKAVEDAAKRAAKRIGVHAIKAASAPRKYIASIEEMMDANADAVRDILDPALQLREQLGGPPADESLAEMSDTIKAQLIRAADVPAKQLAGVVQKWADDAPDYWAKWLGEWEEGNGT